MFYDVRKTFSSMKASRYGIKGNRRETITQNQMTLTKLSTSANTVTENKQTQLKKIKYLNFTDQKYDALVSSV